MGYITILGGFKVPVAVLGRLGDQPYGADEWQYPLRPP